jgi:hypothetical protein
MSFIVKAPEEKFATAPAGTFPAVAVDLIDLGMVDNKFDPEADPRHMCRIVWQLDEEDPKTGKRFLIRKDFTASLHEKAALRKTLEAWRGKPFTNIDLMGFDVESILGASCLLSIVHNTGSKGGTFSNVAGVMKLPKNMTAILPVDYVRVKDRPAEAPAPKPEPPAPDAQAWGISDDDVPF